MKNVFLDNSNASNGSETNWLGVCAAGMVLMLITALIVGGIVEVNKGSVIPGTGGARLQDAQDMLDECQRTRQRGETCVIDLSVRVERSE